MHNIKNKNLVSIAFTTKRGASIRERLKDKLSIGD
jgi:hypothetical protein